MEAADAGVYCTLLPQVVDIMQGHDVGHKSGHEARPVAFVVELQADLLRAGPALGPKRHGQGDVATVSQGKQQSS